MLTAAAVLPAKRQPIPGEPLDATVNGRAPKRTLSELNELLQP